MKFLVVLVLILVNMSSKLDVLETRLKNGVKVLIVKKDSPISAVAIIVGSGAFSDPFKKSGLAHYTEHAMFKGLKDAEHGAEFSKFTKMTGANFNAFTGYNTTAFHTAVPSEYLDDLLKIESQRFNHFFIERESALTERNVVLEELKMYNNYDSYLLFQDIMSGLYAKNNYRNSIAGYADEVNSFTVADVVKFRKRNYVANNMKIIVVSNVDKDVILKKLNHYFGKIRKNKYLKKLPDTTVDVDYPRSSYIVERYSSQTGLNEVSMFWKMPSYNTNKKEMIAMSIAASIMGDKACTFAKTLIKDKQVATNIQTLHNTTYATNEGCPPNLFVIEATSTSKCNADDLVKNIKTELQNLINKGFSKDELQAIKDEFKIRNYYREDNSMNVFNFLINIGINYSYQDFLEYSEILEEIDIAYLNTTFKKYMSRTPDAIGKMMPLSAQHEVKSEKSNVK